MRDYTEAATTVLLDANGAFFAFGKGPHKEEVAGIEYVGLGMGLVVPRKNAQAIVEGFGAITRAGMALDLAENGTKKILWREFANFECQISCSPDDAIEALEGYGITDREIQAEWGAYWAHCVKNDYF